MSQEAVIWATRIAALGTLVLAGTLLWLGPTGVDIDGGWLTPILALEFARNPPPGSYRRSGPFRPPESRPGRSSKATGRNIVFLG